MKTLIAIAITLAVIFYGLETLHGAFNHSQDRQAEVIQTILEGK